MRRWVGLIPTRTSSNCGPAETNEHLHPGWDLVPASWDASRPWARTIAPIGMISYSPHLDAMDICKHDLTNTKKFRNAARTGDLQKLSQPIPGRCLYVEAKRNPGGDMASNTRIPP